MKLSPERRAHSAALRITTIYALFAALWIYLSDNMLSLLLRDPSVIIRISVYKGFLFIAVASLLLFQLIVRHIRRTMEVEKDLNLSRNLMHALINETTDAIFVKDRQGNYLLSMPLRKRSRGGGRWR